MSHKVLTTARHSMSRIGFSALTAVALLGSAQLATAGPTVDQLSDCLVKSTTETDKKTVLQWTFVALSTHPDLKKFQSGDRCSERATG